MEHDTWGQFDPNNHERRYRQQDDRPDSSDHIAAAVIGARRLQRDGLQPPLFTKGQRSDAENGSILEANSYRVGADGRRIQRLVVACGHDDGGNKYFRMMIGTASTLCRRSRRRLMITSVCNSNRLERMLPAVSSILVLVMAAATEAMVLSQVATKPETIRKVWHIDLSRQFRMP